MIGMSIKRISVLNLCHVLKPFVKSTPGGIELSKCVYLDSLGVKIEHTVGVQNKDFFSKCISDGHVYRNICHNQSKIGKSARVDKRIFWP